ncbi:TonB-dependent receptor domain-containing protein [Winogradskyella luteola]|uniref:TonB-dependent receptor n=1 Tax=Winogradskyella luteola TaxID=2828330 RepID=A0A9X1JLX2_9FLAO|nr:TonB-dependent receptor [Winogradskyella luteola]MBV7267820.1 TonB-dependent receptor [Winogradskyella luteola]
MLLPTLAFSQEEAFYIEFKDVPLHDALENIEEVYQVLFSYKDNYIRGKNITLDRKKRTLSEVLNELKNTSGLYYSVLNNRYIIVSLSNDENVITEALDKIVVRSYLAKGIEKNSDGAYKLYPLRLGILPGLIESDVLESIQLLPGVLSPNETASSFFVRGGASDQNRLIWDGINIYHKGHLFGMISPLNPNVTSEIKFINKGSHARYGERLSSVTDIRSSSIIDNDLKAEMGINGVNADAILDLPLIKDKLSLQASLRRSYTDVFETFTFSQLSDKVFDSTKIGQDENGDNDFSFLDYNVKLNYKLNNNNTFFASLIAIDNQLDYTSSNDENNRSFNDIMTIENKGYGLGWNHKWNEKLSQNTQAFFSDYAFNYNFITSENNEQISDFEKRNAIFDSGISTEINYNASYKNNYTFGYQYTLKDVSYAFVNTADLRIVLDTEQEIVQSHSLYGNFDYKNPRLFDFSFGLRGTYFQELDAARLEPRLIIFKELSTHLKLQASAEIKNQIISEIDETVFSDLSLENRVWRLANNNDFPIINSKHVSAGFIYSKKGWSIDADAYYKKLKNITALSLGFLNPDGGGFNNGDQNIFGVDAFLRKRFNGFTTWLSYSYNRARSRFENLNDSKSFKSKSNVTHAVSTALSYKLDGFKIALGWKWQTGRPFTIANETDGIYSFDEGINTAELPIYHRLDLSSTYSFKISKRNKLRGKIGVSVRNLYNRENLISREYRGNNSLNDSVELLERYAIGITPNFMFRLYW